MPPALTAKPGVIRFGDAYYESSTFLHWFGLVAGVFPISRTSEGRYRFRWISMWTFYSIFVYVATSCASTYSAYVKILNFLNPELPFDEYLFTLIFVATISPHWLFQVVSLPSSKGLSEYLIMWTEFQKHFVLVTGSAIKLDTGLKYIYILIVGMCSAVITPLAQTVMLGNFTLLESVGFIHALAIYSFFCVWWSFQCNAFVDAARQLRIIMKKELTEDPMYLNLSRHRDLWERIHALTEKLSSSTGCLYGVYNLFSYLSLFAAVYCAVSHILSTGSTICSPKFAGYVLCVIYFGTHAYAFCNSAHFLQEEITDGVRNDLVQLRVHRLSDSNAREVTKFLDTINAKKVGLLVYGNFTIGRGTITDYASSMAMYCLVLLQFRITLPAGGGT